MTQKAGYKSNLGNSGLRIIGNNSRSGPSNGLGYCGPSNGLGYSGSTQTQQPSRDRYAESRGLGAPRRKY